MEYLDFDLEITSGTGRTYPIAARSLAGEARETMHFPFDDLQLQNRLQSLQIALLRSGGKRRLALTQEEETVKQFGRDLFKALFTGEVLSRYRLIEREAASQGKGVRLKLNIRHPQLAALPWEFLYDPNHAEYLVLSHKTPLVRYLELPHVIQPLPVALPLRILGMVASPSDLEELDIAREMERVQQAIKPLQARGLVELTWLEGQTWRDLQKALRRGPWHIFHFIGHGGFHARHDEGLIALCDEVTGQAHHFRATELARLLGDHSSLRLVLLNACEGARGSSNDIFSSTAAILVQKKIPAVLAMQYEITDRAAIELSRSFYEALAEGLPVDSAVAEARKAISFAVQNTIEWGTPVLYMRSPDGVLFRLGENQIGKVGSESRKVSSEQSTVNSEPGKVSSEQSTVNSEQLPTQSPLSSPRIPHSSLLAPRPSPYGEPDWVEIPAGEFWMGSEKGRDNEKPIHRLHLDTFFIARTPITNTQYALFVQAAKHQPPRHWPNGTVPDGLEDHPVVWVTWHDALAYCHWLSQVTGKKVMIPSEAEWEKAARGNKDKREYPWGDVFEPGRANTKEAGLGTTTPVGQYPTGASPYGVLDMCGNVWEWTRSHWGTSLFEPQFTYPYKPNDGRENLEAGNDVLRVLRGGSRYNDKTITRCALRDWDDPNYGGGPDGLRVGLSPF